VRSAAEVLLGADHWSATFSNDHAPRIPAEIDDRERILAGFRRLWERDAAGPLALAHGDAHVGNTYIDAAGRPRFLDWQGVCRAPAFYDVAYFIGGALDPDDRRAHEQALVRHYLAALSAGDGPTVTFDDAWLDYRRYTLHGFLWAVTPPVMQPPEKVRAMGERHVTAIADHDSLASLDV
jgi:phosphotransferase family enzyme